MNRYLIDNQMKMYYKNMDVAREKHPYSTITEYNDMSYLSLIEKIVKMSDKAGEFL